MVISNVLEIAIGMLLIYTILSLISSSITELISEWLMSLRSKNLYRWVSYLLSNGEAGKGLTKEFYNHPLIASLKWQETDQARINQAVNRFRQRFSPKDIPFDLWKLPTSIPAQQFVIALLDVAQKLDDPNMQANSAAAQAPLNTFENVQSLETTINNIQGHDELKRQLLALVRTSSLTVQKETDELKAAFKNIETWFDTGMQQATVRYRQSVRNITFFVGLAVCIAINADSLMMVNALSNDPAVRNILVARAETFVAEPPDVLSETLSSETSNAESTATPVPEGTAEATPAANSDSEAGTATDTGTDNAAGDTNIDRKSELAATIKQLQSDLNSLDLFGWSTDNADRRSLPVGWGAWFLKIVGLALTAAAISLGAPFWFDLLKKFTAMRKESQSSSSSGSSS